MTAGFLGVLPLPLLLGAILILGSIWLVLLAGRS